MHRDVKPGNILLATDGPVYLSDFGLTRRVDEGASLTEAGELVGSIDYASPEQIDGRDIDGRADVYSLACVTYECLTGSVPYPRDSPMAKLFAHLQEHAPDPSTTNPALPTKLDATLQQGLAKDPAARYPTATELISAVAAALDTDPAPARVRPRRRTLILLAAAALAALGGLAAALTLTLGGTSTPPKPILPLTGDSVVRIDPNSNAVVAAVPVVAPGATAEADGVVWVVSENAPALAELDPTRDKPLRTVALDAGGAPDQIAAGDGAAWLAFRDQSSGIPGRWLWKVDARTGAVSKLPRNTFPASVAAAPGAVYAGDYSTADGVLLRILPRAFVVAATLPIIAVQIENGPAGLWALTGGFGEPTSKATLTRIDPRSGVVLTRFDVPLDPDSFAVGSDSLWALIQGDDSVVELDPRNGAIRHTVRVGRIPTEIAAGAGTIWVANSRDGTVTKIDPDTLDTRTIDVGGTPRGLAAGPEGVWVSVWPS